MTSKRVTQEAFDESYQSNVSDFGMDPEEALAEAVVGFKLQGVDLSNIRTTVPGAAGREELRAVTATRALSAALEAGDIDAVCVTLHELAAGLVGSTAQPGAVEAAGACAPAEAARVPPSDRPVLLAFAGGEGAVAHVLRALLLPPAPQHPSGDRTLLHSLAALKASSRPLNP